MQDVFLVAVQRPEESDWQVADNLAELEELALNAGMGVVGTLVQKRARVEPATFVGKGKLEELSQALTGDEIVIFDDELTPAQQGNVSDVLNVPVLDRTQLILDIFAKRAASREGKIQVELAQLNYLLPRLSGHGEAMSRLGGGIGTRGPGETKLETDRRRARKRISDLKKQLAEVRKVREVHRSHRKRQDAPFVALVGYTNAGKSTLLSALTGEEVYAADQLFATLDPKIRKWQLTEEKWVFLSDTVGFIRKLPHTVVAAFRATLEEVLNADLLLHVIDASHPQMDEQQQAVEDVLREIGCDTARICVYNKIDAMEDGVDVPVYSNAVSARTKENLPSLAKTAFDHLFPVQQTGRYFFRFDELAKASLLREKGQVTKEEFTPEGMILTVSLDPVLARRYQQQEMPKVSEN